MNFTELDDLIPPDVPVRDKRTGHVFCKKQHAVEYGILVADLEIIVYRERHFYLDSGTHIPSFVGYCEYCHEII